MMRCACCADAETCEAWLAEHDSASETPRFCNNKAMLDRLARTYAREEA